MLLASLAAGRAWGATVIRMGDVGYPDSLIALQTDEYAKRVNEALKGRVEIKVFHASQLGTDEEMLKGIKVGVLEMFQPSTVMSTVDPKFGVFEMPYLFKDRDQVKRVAEDPQIKELLFSGLPEKGMRLLGMWENGFRVITNNIRPIVKPDDLKGIKLRVPGGVWRVKMSRHTGPIRRRSPIQRSLPPFRRGSWTGRRIPSPRSMAGSSTRCRSTCPSRITSIRRPTP
jgi:TRAP-type C4-dicarboxylate transport system substrate-binding protein